MDSCTGCVTSLCADIHCHPARQSAFRQANFAAADLDAGGGDRIGDILGADGTEQLPFVTGVGSHSDDSQAGKLGRPLQQPPSSRQQLSSSATGLKLGNVLCRRNRLAPGHQEIAANGLLTWSPMLPSLPIFQRITPSRNTLSCDFQDLLASPEPFLGSRARKFIKLSAIPTAVIQHAHGTDQTSLM